MEFVNLEKAVESRPPITMLIYCPPGVGKSTALGIIAEKSKGRTLVLDVDRTFITTMGKREVVKDLSKIDVLPIENRAKSTDRATGKTTCVGTFDAWSKTLAELDKMSATGGLDAYENICVDNISELERCILSDLGAQGKNKGVPAMADYQYMQFKLVNSLRFMKGWGKNIFWTAWETVEQIQMLDGSSYSRRVPKIASKIVDNICGLCDVVAEIHANKDGTRGFILEATQTIYAKNQLDSRKGCKIEDYIITKEEN